MSLYIDRIVHFNTVRHHLVRSNRAANKQQPAAALHFVYPMRNNAYGHVHLYYYTCQLYVVYARVYLTNIFVYIIGTLMSSHTHVIRAHNCKPMVLAPCFVVVVVAEHQWTHSSGDSLQMDGG